LSVEGFGFEVFVVKSPKRVNFGHLPHIETHKSGYEPGFHTQKPSCGPLHVPRSLGVSKHTPHVHFGHNSGQFMHRESSRVYRLCIALLSEFRFAKPTNGSTATDLYSKTLAESPGSAIGSLQQLARCTAAKRQILKTEESLLASAPSVSHATGKVWQSAARILAPTPVGRPEGHDSQACVSPKTAILGQLPPESR
jgi:hypothetical protein